MSQGPYDSEFFEMIPLNAAEVQAAADAASDPEWSGESRRVTQKIARLGTTQLEI